LCQRKAVIPAVIYRQVWRAGYVFKEGDLATWDGSTWHCNAKDGTTQMPGKGPDWTLMVKKGTPGRDGRDFEPTNGKKVVKA
jgi:hypothetical protein